MVTRIGLKTASDRLVESFFENGRALQNRFLGDNQWGSDLYSRPTESDRREHQHAALEAEPYYVPGQIRIRLGGVGRNARKAGHQPAALNGADLPKTGLHLAQTPVQDIADLAGIRSQLFIDDQVDRSQR